MSGVQLVDHIDKLASIIRNTRDDGNTPGADILGDLKLAREEKKRRKMPPKKAKEAGPPKVEKKKPSSRKKRVRFALKVKKSFATGFEIVRTVAAVAGAALAADQLTGGRLTAAAERKFRGSKLETMIEETFPAPEPETPGEQPRRAPKLRDSGTKIIADFKPAKSKEGGTQTALPKKTVLRVSKTGIITIKPDKETRAVLKDAKIQTVTVKSLAKGTQVAVTKSTGTDAAVGPDVTMAAKKKTVTPGRPKFAGPPLKRARLNPLKGAFPKKVTSLKGKKTKPPGGGKGFKFRDPSKAVRREGGKVAKVST